MNCTGASLCGEGRLVLVTEVSVRCVNVCCVVRAGSDGYLIRLGSCGEGETADGLTGDGEENLGADCLIVGEGGAFSVSVKEIAPYTSTLALQTLVALCHHLPSFSRQRGKNSNQRDRCSFLLLGGSGW